MPDSPETSRSLPWRGWCSVPRWCIALAVVFAVLTAVGYWTDRYDNLVYLRERPLGFALLLVCSFAAYALVLSWVSRLLDRAADASAGAACRSLRWRYPAYAGILLLCWLPWLVVCAPGSLSGDLFSQVPQWLGAEPMTAHHPPLSSAMYGTLFAIGSSIGGSNGALLAIMVAQALAMACALAYALRTVSRLGCPRVLSIGLTVFCAALPVFPTYAQWLVKDTLSSSALCVFMTLLLRQSFGLGETGCQRRWVALAVAGLLSCLLRNNNVFVVLVALAAFALAVPRRSDAARATGRRAALTAAAAVLAANLIVTNLLYPALGIAKGSVKEVLSLPFQQVARCVRDNMEDVTPEQREVIEETLGNSLEGIAASYDESISDPVKDSFQPTGNGGLLRFMAVWLELGMSHPADYLVAAIQGSNGYWYPFGVRAQESNFYSSQAPVSPVTGEEPLWETLGMEPATATFPEMATTAARVGWGLSQLPLISLLYHPATYLWIEAVLAFHVLFSVKKRSCLGMRPMAAGLLAATVILTLTCCASPVNALVRYALSLWFFLPLAAALPFLQKANTSPSEVDDKLLSD